MKRVAVLTLGAVLTFATAVGTASADPANANDPQESKIIRGGKLIAKEAVVEAPTTAQLPSGGAATESPNGRPGARK